MEKQSSSFTTKCLLDFTYLFLNEDTADVHFIFNVDGKDKRVPAHKTILAAGSSVFRSMFYGNLKEEGDVKITDTSPTHFKEFLAFFYLPQTTITHENCIQFIYLAEKYDVSEGINICDQFLLKNAKDILTDIDELWSVFALAIKFNLQKLNAHCVLKIRKNAARVFNSASFVNCPRNILKTILLLDDLKCTDLDVYNGCKTWAESVCTRNGRDATDQQNIRSELDECFYLLPFATMKIGTFSKIVFDSRTLFTHDEIIDIMALITTGATTENTRKFIKNNCTCVSFAWYDEHYLEFKARRTFEECLIFRTEHAVFSSNEKLLFGGVSLVKCYRRSTFINDDTNTTLSATVTITKHDSNDELQETIIVSTDPNEFWPTVIVFDKPFVIYPNTLYKILIDFTANVISGEGLVKYWGCDSSSRDSISHEGISLQFQLHPENMIFSQFYFNRL